MVRRSRNLVVCGSEERLARHLVRKLDPVFVGSVSSLTVREVHGSKLLPEISVSAIPEMVENGR